MFDKGQNIDLSWEITFTDSEASEEGETLTGVAMNGACLVTMPAYEGRTNVTALSSKEGDNKMETIALDKHQAMLDELRTGLEEKQTELQTQLDNALAQVEELTPELEELRKFKSDFENAKAQAEKFNSIKEKFTEAGLELEDAYFNDRKDALLAMDESQIEFFIQELVAVASRKEDEEDEDESLSSKTQLPPVSTKDTKIKMEDILGFLNELDQEDEN
jgi:hypothetical protein